MNEFILWMEGIRDQEEKKRCLRAVVNWPNSELYLRGNCLYNMLHWLVCCKPAGQSCPDFGVWVSEDFDPKYQILWGETRDHGVPIHERRKKVQKKNLHNYSKISTPCNIRLTHVGVEGETHTVLPSRLSQQKAKMANSWQLL